MEIIKHNVASIANNEPGMPRVSLSIATEYDDDGDMKYLVLAGGNDTEYRFSSLDDAETGIYELWGSPVWDIEYK